MDIHFLATLRKSEKMINQELEQNLNSAFKIAQDQKHEFVTVVHLLLALVENSDAQNLFSSNNIDILSLIHI